jgi:GNAT superfamily N-acetyltransferase
MSNTATCCRRAVMHLPVWIQTDKKGMASGQGTVTFQSGATITVQLNGSAITSAVSLSAGSENWFIAQLFVSSGQQGSGIGNELLKRAMVHAEKTGAANKALITFASNRVSQDLYVRHGLFPRLPLYLVSVSREALVGTCKVCNFVVSLLRRALRICATSPRSMPQVFSLSREKHHRFLIDDDGTRGFAFYAGDNCVGYAYVSSGGHIRPLATVKPDDMGTAFRTALINAANGSSSNVSAFFTRH